MKKSRHRWIYIVSFIIVAVLAFFLIFAAERPFYFDALDLSDTDSKWLINQPIAHRGYHNEKTAPENSLEAFAAAINKGYAIELDVRLTKDSKAVVIHDDNLLRMTGKDINVSDMSLEEIQKLYLLETNSIIPSLSDTLEFIKGRVPILLEIKSKGFSHELDELVYSIIKDYKGSLVVQSFNASSMRWFWKNAPSVTRGMLLSGNSNFNMADRFIDNLYMLYSHPNFVAYKYVNLIENDFSDLRKNGLIVLGWTVSEKMLNTREFTSYCDNIILEAEN